MSTTKKNHFWFEMLSRFYTLGTEVMEYPFQRGIILCSLGSGLTWVCTSWPGIVRTKNDTQVRPEPREHNEFHQFRESGKSDILLGRHVLDVDRHEIYDNEFT
jgi:hypothetical protein